jgi:hypothetical protein
MGVTMTGGCLCGAVRYVYEGEPGPANYCHCTDCRRRTGSAFNVSVRGEAASLRLLGGSPKGFTKAADSGNELTRFFCPDCGSPLWTAPQRYPGTVFIAAGCIDDPSLVRPKHQSWTDSRVPWAEVAHDLASFARGRT